MTTRHYTRLVGEWVASIGLDASKFGTHSLRRTKAVLIYRRTGNLRAVQLLLGHTKIESTVRYLGIEADDALAIAEQNDAEVPGQSRPAHAVQIGLHNEARPAASWLEALSCGASVRAETRSFPRARLPA